VKILSATEDFERVSLAAFARVLEKLAYLAGLQDKDGRYQHWGMAKSYGQEAASKTIAEAHGRAFAEYLRAPLHKLAEEVVTLAHQEGIPGEAYVQRLEQNARVKGPPEVKKGAPAKHSAAVILALKKIARAGRSAGRQSAWQPRPPAPELRRPVDTCSL